MRVLVLGGTRFIGRRIVERLRARGDETLVVHRGRREGPEARPGHVHVDRRDLRTQAGTIAEFEADAVIDTCAMSGADVTAVLPVLPQVATVVLSSQDVYQAVTGLRTGRCEAAVPLDEDAELRRDRYPYWGAGHADVPDDYEKIDVEQAWLRRGATILRLPMVFGPHDQQRREDPVLRRIRAGRHRMPIGVGNLLWTRGHVDDIATGVLAAVDSRAADGLPVNLGETATVPIRAWWQQIVAAADAELELVTVPDAQLPEELAIARAPEQHLLVSVQRAKDLLGWAPTDSARRVTESVRWHLDNPPETGWTQRDSDIDDLALRAA